MTEPTDILQAWQYFMSTTFVVFLRIGSFCSLLPGIGEQSVPVRVKLVVCLALTGLIAPLATSTAPQAPVLWVIFSEILVGLFLGLLLRLALLALHTAGSIAAQATSLAQLLGNNTTEPLPAIGHTLVVSGLAIVFLSGLHFEILRFFLYSYRLFPIGLFPAADTIAQMGIDHIAKFFALSFVLAAPFVVLSVIYNLALGAINKAMPQLMVAFVGAPLITAGGLILLFLTAPTILIVWVEAVRDLVHVAGNRN